MLRKYFDQCVNFGNLLLHYIIYEFLLRCVCIFLKTECSSDSFILKIVVYLKEFCVNTYLFAHNLLYKTFMAQCSKSCFLMLWFLDDSFREIFTLLIMDVKLKNSQTGKFIFRQHKKRLLFYPAFQTEGYR